MLSQDNGSCESALNFQTMTWQQLSIMLYPGRTEMKQEPLYAHRGSAKEESRQVSTSSRATANEPTPSPLHPSTSITDTERDEMDCIHHLTLQ